MLNGDGEAEALAADVQRHAHLRHEQAEGLAHAHGERDDQRGGQDDDPGPPHGHTRISSMRSRISKSRGWSGPRAASTRACASSHRGWRSEEHTYELQSLMS